MTLFSFQTDDTIKYVLIYFINWINELEKQTIMIGMIGMFLSGLSIGLAIGLISHRLIDHFGQKKISKKELLQKEIQEKRKRVAIYVIFTISSAMIFVITALLFMIVSSSPPIPFQIILLIYVIVFIILIIFMIRKMRSVNFTFKDSMTSKDGLFLFLLSFGVFIIIFLWLLLQLPNTNPILFPSTSREDAFFIYIVKIPNLANSILFMAIGIFYFFKKRAKIQK